MCASGGCCQMLWCLPSSKTGPPTGASQQDSVQTHIGRGVCLSPSHLVALEQLVEVGKPPGRPKHGLGAGGGLLDAPITPVLAGLAGTGAAVQPAGCHRLS